MQGSKLMKEDRFNKAFSHILNEIRIPNIAISIKNNFEELQKPHDSIHEFMHLVTLCILLIVA